MRFYVLIRKPYVFSIAAGCMLIPFFLQLAFFYQEHRHIEQLVTLVKDSEKVLYKERVQEEKERGFFSRLSLADSAHTKTYLENKWLYPESVGEGPLFAEVLWKSKEPLVFSTEDLKEFLFSIENRDRNDAFLSPCFLTSFSLDKTFRSEEGRYAFLVKMSLLERLKK